MSIIKKLTKESELTFQNLVQLKISNRPPPSDGGFGPKKLNPGRKQVRLTPSQVAIAKKLGVPLEEYAKQLKNTKEA